EKNVFLKMNGQRMMQDMWMLGAVSIFFLYILLSWVVTRYRPYIWLLLFITGIGLYALTVSGYLVDWFFSENPQTGWMLNIHFTHMGLFGVYMLILDFWQLKIKSLFLYRWCLLVLTGVGFVSMISFCLDYFASNYNLMNNINLVSFIFPLSFISYTIPTCWRSLNRAQRYLAYGIILFVISAIAVTLSSALLHEKALQFSPYIVNFTMVGIVVLFSTGLKEELRQAEIDKQAALNELSLLQQNQNIVLEQKVEVRTSELIHSYKELQVQKNILGERNQKIEILINELHHRVKNNLQLLYSFMSLQLPGVKDQAAQDILHNNITRIKAMMLVNNRLSGLSDGSQTDIPAFTEELIKSVQNVYDPRKKVQIELSIDDHSHFNGKQTLSYGLILTELLTNSFKHAFSDHQDPRICISMHSSAKQQSELIYKDNGPGIPHTATNQSSSMGLSLIKDLSRQMQASLLVKYEHGLTYIFTFK
ncbi:MAG TPA: histidine kinase dimerization/phosphoacceptor domain -containing protein, partial [Flavisolibacter sp.]|nr:histidine kinase dimerization/phosphoacceptor domain -containing protein [Flavisolibacter sp.]